MARWQRVEEHHLIVAMRQMGSESVVRVGKDLTQPGRNVHMHAEIAINGAGRGSISLDGQDVSKATRGFALTGSVGDVTRLELDLAIFEDAKLSGEVDVIIPPAAVELLERLGWTPPTPNREIWVTTENINQAMAD